ncbi:MAG: type II methionyl aminopeptidase [Euryarchaeota archaeon]|nr:type II methionyl aminopeptidase [Euryarchaeota archaeon]
MADDDLYRKAGRAAAAARDHGASLLRPGAFLLDVAEEMESRVRKEGAGLAFPVNISINDIAAHFTPTSDCKARFETGMLVTLDVGAHVEGRIGDTAITVEIVSRRWGNLIKASCKALDQAIEMLRPGMEMRLVGGAIERTIGSFGYRPVCNLTGHSVSPYALHSGVSVPNVDDASKEFLREGEAVAVEPFATNGAGRIKGTKNSSIYRLLREPKEAELAEFPLLGHISREFRTLPFAERWCAKVDEKAGKQLARLLRRGVINYYPILVEVEGGMVSQAEHTMIVRNDGVEVTT